MANQSGYAYEVTSLAFAPMAPDGGFGVNENFVEYNDIVLESLSFIQQAGTKTDFLVETKTDPIVSIPKAGVKDFKANIYVKSPEQLVFFFGGTIVTTGVAPNVIKTYKSNDSAISKEVSCKIITNSGPVLKIIRLQINAVLNLVFSHTKVWQIDVTGTVLTPLKDGLESYDIDYPQTA